MGIIKNEWKNLRFLGENFASVKLCKPSFIYEGRINTEKVVLQWKLRFLHLKQSLKWKFGEIPSWRNNHDYETKEK